MLELADAVKIRVASSGLGVETNGVKHSMVRTSPVQAEQDRRLTVVIRAEPLRRDR